MAVSGPLMHVPINDIKMQIDVNVLGVMRVTQTFLPLLGAVEINKEKPGKIINISSVSGKIAYPFVGPYAASKHALEAISHCLRRELSIYGIDVIIVGPGSIDTPIWNKETVEDMPVKYADTAWGKVINSISEKMKNEKENYLRADRLAQRIWQIYNKKHPRARYAYVNHFLVHWILPRIIPSRLLDYFMHKSLKMEAK